MRGGDQSFSVVHIGAWFFFIKMEIKLAKFNLKN